MTYKPRMWHWIAAAGFGLALVFWSAKDPDDVMHMAGFWFGGTFLLSSLFLCLRWMAFNWAQIETIRATAKAITPTVKLADILARMTDRQIEAYRLFVPQFLVNIETNHRVVKLITPWGDIPEEFVDRWVELCTVTHLCRRDHPSFRNSADRNYSDWLTDYLIQLGYAEPNRSRWSARWVSYPRYLAAMRVLGYDGEGGGADDPDDDDRATSQALLEG